MQLRKFVVAKKLVVILDTNVFISGLLSPNGVPGAIIRKFRQGEFHVVSSKEQFEEILDVMERPHIKKILPESIRNDLVTFLKKLKKLIQIFKTTKHKWDFVDEGDHFLFDLILASKADYLVTGDKKVVNERMIENCHIVSPVEFLAGF